jgi:hypothetical protein
VSRSRTDAKNSEATHSLPRVFNRMVQAEYFLTKIPDGLNRQNNLRFSVGIVHRFGRG